MTKEKYQIEEKSNYITILILYDELKNYDKILSEEIIDIDSHIDKFRHTRNIFISLNNVFDAIKSIKFNQDNHTVELTRTLKKELKFANHFRNRLSGHLCKDLIERAVQWDPTIFDSELRNKEKIKIFQIYKTLIESGINSYIDENGVQKIFKTEIDLFYPPDANLFYQYLKKIVDLSIEWLSIAEKSILVNIKHYDNYDTRELSAIAAKTNFNLKEKSEFSYSNLEYKNRLEYVIEELKKVNTDDKIIDFLKTTLEK